MEFFDFGTFLGVSGTLSVFSVILSIFSSLASAAIYIVGAIAVYNFCKKLSIPSPWLAFVPIANVYKLGQAAEKCCEINGEKKKYAKLLLTLEIITWLLIIPYIVFLIVFVFSMVSAGVAQSETGIFSSLLLLLIALLFVLLMLASAVTLSVFTFIAYYKIFKVFVPENATLYIILTLVLSLTCGFPCIMTLIASLKSPAIAQQANNENVYTYTVNN